MVTLSLYLDKRTTLSDKTHPIVITIRCQNKSRLIRTGISVKESQWDGQKVVKHRLGPAFNLSLEEMLTRARRAILDTESRDGRHNIVSATEVVTSALYPERKKEEEPSTTGLIGIYNEVTDTKRDSTRDTYLRGLKHIREYIAPKDDVPIDKVSYAWLKAFDNYLEAKGLVANTRAIYFRNLRTVFNYAITEERTTNYPFRKFQIKTEETVKRNLSVAQMHHLFTMDVADWIRPYLDFFLLSFLLIGINPKDLLFLKKSDIVDGRVVYHRFKTKRLYSILVPPEAWAIIRKYPGEKYLLDIMDRHTDYRNFVRQANQALQRIGRSYTHGFNVVSKPEFPDLTMYWARHTWATIAASLDVPTDTIALALGHGPKKVTHVYIDFEQRKVDQANYVVIAKVMGRM